MEIFTAFDPVQTVEQALAGGIQVLPCDVEHIALPALPALSNEDADDALVREELARCAGDIVVAECPALFEDWVYVLSAADAQASKGARHGE